MSVRSAHGFDAKELSKFNSIDSIANFSIAECIAIPNEKSLSLFETKPSTFELIKIFLSKIIKLGRINSSERSILKNENK